MNRRALLASALFLGCSSSSTPAPDSPDAASHDAGGQGALDAGAGVDSGTDSGADAVAPPRDSGTTADTRIDPIVVGYVWTYDVQAVGAGSVCGAGSHDSRVVSQSTVGGKTAFQVASFCSGAGTSDYAVNGDEVDLYYSGTWLIALDGVVQDGHTWSYANTSFTWKKEGSVNVPAGTFPDCWTAKQNVSYTAFTTYCRGVGIVRSYSMDLAGNGWDARAI